MGDRQEKIPALPHKSASVCSVFRVFRRQQKTCQQTEISQDHLPHTPKTLQENTAPHPQKNIPESHQKEPSEEYGKYPEACPGETQENTVFNPPAAAYETSELQKVSQSRETPESHESHDPPEPQEVVETYSHRMGTEVVESYSRPLPMGHSAAKEDWTLRIIGIQSGMVIPIQEQYIHFLDNDPWLEREETVWDKCRDSFHAVLSMLSVILVLAVLGYLLNGIFLRNWDTDTEEEELRHTVNIPTVPSEENIRLTIQREHGEKILSPSEIYQQVNPSVVTVMARLEESTSVGTGVIFSERGYIVTNFHVVAGGNSCDIALSNGEIFSACYIAGDESNDLAVLRIRAGANTPLPAAEIGNSDLLTVGDPVFAIGNPLGMELRGTFTAGIVSAINRDVTVKGNDMTLIQTDAALNSGNSGGPLINTYGQVVGINVIKMSSRSASVEGLGFAIPSANMWRMVNDLLNWGEITPEPQIGVVVMNVGTEIQPNLWGILVDDIIDDGAAQQAGVKAGDYIIRINNEPIYTIQDINWARRASHIGDYMTLLLWRDGEELEVRLFLAQAAK